MANPAWHYVLKFIITGDAALGVEFGSKLITLPDAEGTVVNLQCWDTAGTESFRSITRSYYRGAAGCLLVYDVSSRRSFGNVRNWLADVRAHAETHVSCILVGNKGNLCEGDDLCAGAATGGGCAHDASSAANVHAHGKTARSRFGGRCGVLAGPALHSTPSASRLQLRCLARETCCEGLFFAEASAKSGAGVEAAFVAAAGAVLGKVKGGKFDNSRGTLPAEAPRAQCCAS
ncbi:ras-domain-containing protein [Mycena vulgaris]|nr:ras-domain-containing protein [Mycena vulgaris]